MVNGNEVNNGEGWTTVSDELIADLKFQLRETRRKIKNIDAEMAKAQAQSKKVCFDWKAGHCSRYNCKFAHTDGNKRATSTGTKKPKTATLREIRAYVQQVQGMAFKDVPHRLPQHILRGVKYYNITTEAFDQNGNPVQRELDLRKSAWQYGQQVTRPQQEIWFEYQLLLEAVNKHMLPQFTRGSGRNDQQDSMSVASFRSSRTWNSDMDSSPSSTPSVISESLFDAKCKLGSGQSRAMCSEKPTSNVRRQAKSTNGTALEKLVVLTYPTAPVYSAPSTSSDKVATVKRGTLVTVFERQFVEPCSWVRTSLGWMIRHVRNSKVEFMARPRRNDALRVKLAHGLSLSIRKNPVDLKKLSKDPLAKDIVGKLKNGDEVVVLERYPVIPSTATRKDADALIRKTGEWIRHADGWTLLRLKGSEFFERADVNRAGARKSIDAVCFEFQELGFCAKRNCPYKHEASTKAGTKTMKAAVPATLMGQKQALLMKKLNGLKRQTELKKQRKQMYNRAVFKN